MIANPFNTALGFPVSVQTALLPLLVLALLSAIPAARQPASIKNATIWEAMIRALTVTYFLCAVFVAIPLFERILAGFVTTLPLVTEFTIGLSRTIREFASTPVGAAGVVLCFVAAVATDTTIYSRLAAKDVSQSRRVSIIVSVITLVTLGVMAISLVHPLINLHNDFS